MKKNTFYFNKDMKYMRTIPTFSNTSLVFGLFFNLKWISSALCFSEILLSFNGNFANNFTLTRILPGGPMFISQFYK